MILTGAQDDAPSGRGFPDISVTECRAVSDRGIMQPKERSGRERNSVKGNGSAMATKQM